MSANPSPLMVIRSCALLKVGLSTSNEREGEVRVAKTSWPNATTIDSDSRRPGTAMACLIPRVCEREEISLLAGKAAGRDGPQSLEKEASASPQGGQRRRRVIALLDRLL